MKKIYHIQPKPNKGPDGYNGPLTVEPDDFFPGGVVGYRMGVTRCDVTNSSLIQLYILDRDEYDPIDFDLDDLLEELYPKTGRHHGSI